MNGTLIPVEVATHVAGTLEFESGAVVSIAMSFDVPKHRHAPIELYGTEATLLVPDPNRFGGAIEVGRNKNWYERPVEHAYADGNYRMTTYAQVMAAVRAGSASSTLVAVTQSNGSMYRYWSGNAATKADLVRKWVVEN
jgi:hypothetical protein